MDATTTALGIAAAWPLGESCVVAEFDAAGGCLAAWLDVPRSPGLAEVAASSTPGSWTTIASMVQRAESGLDVLVAPTRAVEATAVVLAATASVLPVLAALESPVVIADGGRLRGALTGLARSGERRRRRPSSARWFGRSGRAGTGESRRAHVPTIGAFDPYDRRLDRLSSVCR